MNNLMFLMKFKVCLIEKYRKLLDQSIAAFYDFYWAIYSVGN